MTYKYVEDDMDMLKDLHDAIKGKPKEKVPFDENRLRFLNLKKGESTAIRVVQLNGLPTFLRKKQHYVRAVNVKGINIPSKVAYAPCTETDKCIGEQIYDYIEELKSHTEFKSDENKALFSMRNSVEASETLFMIAIDRSDGALKIFQAARLVGPEILEKAMNKKKYGLPSHPKTGYDWTISHLSNGKWEAKPSDDESPLTAEEIKKIANCTFTWQRIHDMFNQEFQDKLGIRFGDLSENVSSVAGEASTPVKEPEKVVAPPDDLISDADDEIPF